MTQIPLDDGTVRRLDKLRAAVRRRTGQPISRGETLDRLVEDAYESRDEVVDLFREGEVYVAGESGTVQHPRLELGSGEE